MNARDIPAKAADWILRSTALHEARAQLASAEGERAMAARQAKLVLEAARRIAEPREALPPGAPAAVALGLYREAIYWALAARHAGPGAPPEDLRALWDASAPHASASPPDNPTSAALRKTLFDDHAPRSLAVSDADVARVRAFAEGLVFDLDAPRRAVERLLVQRWLRVGLVALALVVVAIAGRAVALGPNLAASKPFRVSSWLPGWASCAANDACKGLMFHTETEDNPWVEIDLGAPRKVTRVEVINRGDCCADRAVPLVAEVSNDRASWTEVARRNEPFGSWNATFPARVARYVRLRAPRRTVLHLMAIAVR